MTPLEKDQWLELCCPKLDKDKKGSFQNRPAGYSKEAWDLTRGQTTAARAVTVKEWKKDRPKASAPTGVQLPSDSSELVNRRFQEFDRGGKKRAAPGTGQDELRMEWGQMGLLEKEQWLLNVVPEQDKKHKGSFQNRPAGYSEGAWELTKGQTNVERAATVKEFEAHAARKRIAKQAAAPVPKEGHDKLAFTVATTCAAKEKLKITRADGSGAASKSWYAQRQEVAEKSAAYFAAAAKLSTCNNTQVFSVVVTGHGQHVKNVGPGRPNRDGGGASCSRLLYGVTGFPDDTPPLAAALAMASATSAALIGTPGTSVEHQLPHSPTVAEAAAETVVSSPSASVNGGSEEWDARYPARPELSTEGGYVAHIGGTDAAAAAAASAAAWAAATANAATGAAVSKAARINATMGLDVWTCHANPQLPHTATNPALFYVNAANESSWEPVSAAPADGVLGL